MEKRVNLELAYILHRHPYSNTSWIVEFFTEKYGRMSAVARSARGLKSRYRGKLELFFPMLISWSGRAELKTLGAVEFSAAPMLLDGNALLCGFYLNEILMRLLHRDDPHAKLFYLYHETLQALQIEPNLQIILRRFEKKLLDELGYGLSLTHEILSGSKIEEQARYKFFSERGFVRCYDNDLDSNVFSGASLLALHNEQWDDKSVLLEMKKLMRLVLSFYLGDKPLKSRDLMR